MGSPIRAELVPGKHFSYSAIEVIKALKMTRQNKKRAFALVQQDQKARQRHQMGNVNVLQPIRRDTTVGKIGKEVQRISELLYFSVS